jgi:hypothetical protein
LDNPQQQQQQQQSIIRPLLSPQQLHPNAITTPSMTSSSNTIQNIQLPITAATQYPVRNDVNIISKTNPLFLVGLYTTYHQRMETTRE